MVSFDTHKYKEVAKAKLISKQNLIVFWWLVLVYISGKAARRVLRSKP